MCYIETSNLDGETNLKVNTPVLLVDTNNSEIWLVDLQIRSSLQATADLTSEQQLSRLTGIVEAELPNR